MRDQLAARGVDADSVLHSYEEFLEGSGSYSNFLRRRHPYNAIEVPDVEPDQPPARRSPTNGQAAPVERVDVAAEVNAFAYLIASKKLATPLAVGLFGDWGGGKSYFLRSLQRHHRRDPCRRSSC